MLADPVVTASPHVSHKATVPPQPRQPTTRSWKDHKNTSFF